MALPYKWFRFPFAVAGDLTAVPDTVQSDGSISYNQGYGPDYQLDPATQPAALNIERQKFNQVMNDVTTFAQYIQTGQIPVWLAASDNGGTSVSYTLGAVIRYPVDGLVYQSVSAANTVTPGTDLTKWVPVNFGGGTVNGECRLSVASATSLKLAPYKGNQITVNGVNQIIPAAGVTIANTGLAASTTYYVYAFISSGALALEISATGHSTDTNGIEIKTGDSSRSLVGMIRTSNNTPGQFVDASRQRFCANWFNRRRRAGFNFWGVTLSTTSGTIVDVGASYHAEFLTWADEAVGFGFQGPVSNTTAASTVNLSIGIDGTSVLVMPTLQITVVSNSASSNGSFGEVSTDGLAEGYHYATMVGFAGSNTAQWFAGGQITIGLNL